MVLLLAADLDDGKGGGDAEEAAPAAATAGAPPLGLVLLPVQTFGWLHALVSAAEKSKPGPVVSVRVGAASVSWTELLAAVADDAAAWQAAPPGEALLCDLSGQLDD